MTASQKASRDKENSSDIQFWTLAHRQAELTERERIEAIQKGFQSVWLLVVKSNFKLTKGTLATLANLSPASLDRRIKGESSLSTVASERFDRLAQTAVLAEEVFEDRTIASEWMSTPNDLLGGDTPLTLCETELGARQVRRVLHSIDWGNVA